MELSTDAQTPTHTRSLRHSFFRAISAPREALIAAHSADGLSFFLLLFSFFVPIPNFPQRNFARGSPRNDDRQLGRPTTSPVLSLFVRISFFQSRSLPAIGSPPRNLGLERQSSVQLRRRRPSGVQNRPLLGVFSATQLHKGNRIIETYGAGDGNRTHFRNLGWYWASWFPFPPHGQKMIAQPASATDEARALHRSLCLSAGIRRLMPSG